MKGAYIFGSSKNNMWSRIYDHLYLKEKYYALSDFILIGDIEGVYDDTKINDEDFCIILHQVEDYLIEKYSPRLNKRRISKYSTVYNIKIEEKYA